MRLSNGDVRNAYTVKVLNKLQTEQRFQLALEGLPGATLGLVGTQQDGLVVHPDAVGTYRVLITVPADKAPSGARPVRFAVRDPSGRVSASHEAVFVGPNR